MEETFVQEMGITAMQIHPIRLISNSYWKEKPAFVQLTETERCWTMMAVEAGTFRFAVDGVQGEAGAGEMVLCPPHLRIRRVRA